MHNTITSHHTRSSHVLYQLRITQTSYSTATFTHRSNAQNGCLFLPHDTLTTPHVSPRVSTNHNRATVDPGLLYAQWPTVLGLLLGLVTFKSIIISTSSLGFGLKLSEAVRTGLILSGGGEFAFVVSWVNINTSCFFKFAHRPRKNSALFFVSTLLLQGKVTSTPT